ncbi:helix-turn-helix domain-containing protein [Desulfoluna spongiiphila]|uniref:helix-turn-helix domain-containing protein n=1 Tax=Desulfoluna spongiiphila TaxID=419481 RepID=UPI00125B603A|nr:helix-turn-helix domain-containing protein [Desulfoluna spongiiphila]VVS91037.1 helix-turn-helix domain [Desulfoluna spongiiphila]
MDLTHSEMEAMAAAIAGKVADTLRAEQTVQRWLTLEEAVEYARASKNSLRRWIDAGHIYAFRRTGKLIVDRESIDAWYSSEIINFPT